MDRTDESTIQDRLVGFTELLLGFRLAHTYQDAVGMEKIFYTGPFPEELRVRGHAEVVSVSAAVDCEQMPNLLPRFNRNAASYHHEFLGRRCGRDEPCHTFDGGRVGVASLHLWYADADEDDIARANGLRGISGERQAAFPAAPGQHFIEVRLIDGGFPVL